MKTLKKLNVSKMWIAVIGAVCLAAALMIPMMSFANTADGSAAQDANTPSGDANEPTNATNVDMVVTLDSDNYYIYNTFTTQFVNKKWSHSQTIKEGFSVVFTYVKDTDNNYFDISYGKGETAATAQLNISAMESNAGIYKVLVDGVEVNNGYSLEIKDGDPSCSHTVNVYQNPIATHSVSGKLVDTKGNPMANQTAKLYYYPETTPALTQTTATDGTFTFESVPEGSTIAVTFDFENGEVKPAYVRDLSKDTNLGNLIYRIDCYIDFTIDSAKGKIVGAEGKEYPAGTFDTWEGTKVTITDTGADFVFPAEYGEEMSVKAVANEGYTFAGFTVTDAATGDELTSPFEINSDIKVVANFKETATTATGSSSTGDTTPFVVIAVIAVVAGASAFAVRKFNNR